MDMGTRDLGVAGDYMDRAFRRIESGGWSSKGSIAQKAAEKRAKKAAIRQLARTQASRPLKPPGR